MEAARIAVGARIRQARERAGIGQAELARSIGLKNRQDINQIETRARVKMLDTIEKIASALGVSPGWLAWGETERRR